MPSLMREERCAAELVHRTCTSRSTLAKVQEIMVAARDFESVYVNMCITQSGYNPISFAELETRHLTDHGRQSRKCKRHMTAVTVRSHHMMHMRQALVWYWYWFYQQPIAISS